MTLPASKYVMVDGMRTHFLEAGDGPIVVLLHSGEFGGCAEISWEFTIGPLSAHFRVIAPDWLGFGRTDKLYDFTGGQRRTLAHMRRFLEVMAIDDADFIGNSMGGTYLARAAALGDRAPFPLRRIVLASGGGFVPFNEHRQALMDYDCTIEGMTRIVRAAFHDPRWAEDEAYIQKRHALSLIPGAWECTAAARLKSPAVAPREDLFGAPDPTPYENIKVPTLIIAGAEDKLRQPGYAQELGRRIPDARVHVFEGCGHCPNIEQADRFNETVLAFLTAPRREVPALAS